LKLGFFNHILPNGQQSSVKAVDIVAIVAMIKNILFIGVFLVLFVLLINDLRTELTVPYEGYSWMAILMIGRDWLIATLIIALVFSMRRWRKEISDDH